MFGDCGACCAQAAELELTAMNAAEAASEKRVIPRIGRFSHWMSRLENPPNRSGCHRFVNRCVDAPNGLRQHCPISIPCTIDEPSDCKGSRLRGNVAKKIGEL